MVNHVHLSCSVEAEGVMVSSFSYRNLQDFFLIVIGVIHMTRATLSDRLLANVREGREAVLIPLAVRDTAIGIRHFITLLDIIRLAR